MQIRNVRKTDHRRCSQFKSDVKNIDTLSMSISDYTMQVLIRSLHSEQHIINVDQKSMALQKPKPIWVQGVWGGCAVS